MGDVLERPQVHPFVMPELPGGHVSVILHVRKVQSAVMQESMYGGWMSAKKGEVKSLLEFNSLSNSSRAIAVLFGNNMSVACWWPLVIYHAIEECLPVPTDLPGQSREGSHPDDLPDMLWWHVLLLAVLVPKLPFVPIPLGVQLLPLPCLQPSCSAEYCMQVKSPPRCKALYFNATEPQSYAWTRRRRPRTSLQLS